MVKVKWGIQAFQTGLGNNWNQKFLLDRKQGDLRVEVWQKKSEFQFVGDAIVPRYEGQQQLQILCQGKKEGILNIQLKEAQKDPQLQSIDDQKQEKLQGPQKLIQKLNDSLQIAHDYVSVQDYFKQQWNENTLQIKAKQSADTMVKETLNKILQNFNVAETVSGIDEIEPTQAEQDQVRKLQKQLMKKDLAKLEKDRREIALKILDLDEVQSQMRVDQVEEKNRIGLYRKELTQKLLYIEDRVEHLKREIKSENHHVFGANANLANSEIELSQLSIQKEFLTKWESDPVKQEARKLFVQKQMKEWHDLQEQRRLKLEESQKKIDKAKAHILEQEKLAAEAKSQELRNEITARLSALKDKQKQRLHDYAEATKRFEEKKKTQYLAQKYAEQDALLVEKEKELRKLKLKTLKNPEFDVNEINKFDEQFLKIKIEKAENRKKQWEEREAKWNKFKAQYYSDSYKKAKEEQHFILNPIEESKKRAQEKLQLYKSYEQEIKVKHRPLVSEVKQQELEENIRRLKNEPNFKQYRDLSEKVKLKHIYQGVKPVEKNKIVLKPLEVIPVPLSPRAVGNYYLEQNATYNIKHIPSRKPRLPDPLPQSSQSEKKLPTFDYLKEQRAKKQQVKQSTTQQEMGLQEEDAKMVLNIKSKLAALNEYF